MLDTMPPPAAAPLGRRRAAAVLAGGLLALGLAACGLQPKEYGPGEKPFWEREEQRDD